jgi:putative peptidoglycan lipid II flippase
MAFCFGDNPSVAAFMIAFRLSHLFRRLLGEGPFQSAFIPYFQDLKIKDEVRAALFFRSIASFILMILSAATVIAEIILLCILSFYNVSPENREILILTAWMFPGVIFICLYGLNLSLLNCYDSFFIPGFAPVICNILWIAAAIFLKYKDPASAMPILAKWVTCGLFCQWLFTMPATLKHVTFYFNKWKDWKISAEIMSLAKNFSMGIIGVGAMQINGVVDAIFARYADVCGPVHLWYSIRLYQVVLAVFGIACVSIVVPGLSKAIKMKNFSDAQEIFSFSCRRIITMMIPSTFAVFALGFAVVDIFYGRGQFSHIAVFKTAMCLCAYGIGLLPAALVMLFSSIFYANDNFNLPTIISILAVMINVGLNGLFVLVFHFGSVSVALATGLSAFINCFLLYAYVFKMGIFKSEFSNYSILRLVFISFFALFGIFLADYFMCGVFPFSENFIIPLNFIGKILNIILKFFIFISVVFIGAYFFKDKNILEIFFDFLPFGKRKLAGEKD